MNIFKKCSGPKLFLTIVFFLTLSYITTTLVDRVIWPNSYNIHTSSGSVHPFRISSANYGPEQEFKVLLDQDIFAADLYDPAFFEKPSFLPDIFQLKSLSLRDGVAREVWEAQSLNLLDIPDVEKVVFSIPHSIFIHNISENSSLLDAQLWMNGQKLRSGVQQGSRHVLELPQDLGDIDNIKVIITSRIYNPHCLQKLVSNRSFELKDLILEHGRVREVWAYNLFPPCVNNEELDSMLEQVPTRNKFLLKKSHTLNVPHPLAWAFAPAGHRCKRSESMLKDDVLILKESLGQEHNIRLAGVLADNEVLFPAELTEPGYLVLSHTPEPDKKPRIRSFPEPDRNQESDTHFELRVNGHILPLIRRDMQEDQELIYFLVPELIFRDLSPIYSLEITKDTLLGPPRKTMLADMDRLRIRDIQLSNKEFIQSWAYMPGKPEIPPGASPVYYVVSTSPMLRDASSGALRGSGLSQGLQDELSVSLIINGRELEFSHQLDGKFFFRPDIHPALINELKIMVTGPAGENGPEILLKSPHTLESVYFLDDHVHPQDLTLNIDHVQFMSHDPGIDLAEYSIPFLLGTPIEGTAIDSVRFYVFSNKLPFDINVKTMKPAEIFRVFRGYHNLNYTVGNQSLVIEPLGADPYLFTTESSLLKSTLQKPLKHVSILISAGVSLVFFLFLAVFNKPLARFSHYYNRFMPEDKKPNRFLALAFFILNIVLAGLFGKITLTSISFFLALSILVYLTFPLVVPWLGSMENQTIKLRFIPKRIAAHVFLYLLFIAVLQSAGYAPGWYVIVSAISWLALALIWMEIRNWSFDSIKKRVKETAADFADKSWTPGTRAVLNLTATILTITLVYALQTLWTKVLLVVLIFISVIVLNFNHLAGIGRIVESYSVQVHSFMNMLLFLILCAFAILAINPLLNLAGEHGLIFTIIAAFAGFWAFYLNQETSNKES